MKLFTRSLWLTFSLLTLTFIVFLAILWPSNPASADKLKFLLIGALIGVPITLSIETYRRTMRARDLARALHLELADLVARCCFDMEAPWQKIKAGAEPENQKFNAIWLRKFIPAEPVIFPSTAGELAMLGGSAPMLLIQFHYRLNALRSSIENITKDATEVTRMERISQGALKQVGLRFQRTLEPGRKALEAFSSLVPDSNAVEAFAIKQYDDTRGGSHPSATLRDRITALLKA